MNDFIENENVSADGVNQPEQIVTEQISSDSAEPVYAELYQNNNNFDKIQYSKINKCQPISKGIKIFAFLMAIVILVSASCLGGYYIGKSKIFENNFTDTTLNLEAKPTNIDEMTPAQVLIAVDKSIVGITVYNSEGTASTASGVVYTEDGYIITNDHIYDSIADAKFRVRFYDGKEYSAEFVAGDTRSDLAVLKIDGNGFIPALFGNSDEIITGENVVAVGRPLQAKDNCITEGIISLKERRVTVASSYSMKMIQTSAPINPGSSGGALVNMYGQVVGITSSKISGEKYEATGFAIPTTTTKRIVESLIKYGCVNDRARLGISYQTITELMKEVGDYRTTGILVVSVSNDSDLFGKIKEGDIITHVNGTAITSDEIILSIIESAKPDQKLEFTVYTSDGGNKQVTAKLLPDTGSSSYVYATVQ
ncbi:MAG: trypsin-like serine protease [Ruminococcaceae bacterium]|nr:trypsin-like serine protease [Oscillospiraceae bacterium]